MSDDATPDQRPLVVRCPICKSNVMATEQGSVEDGNPAAEVALFRCDECGSPLLYRKELDYDWDEQNVKFYVTQRLWPQPSISLGEAVPLSLRQEYAQARLCFEASAYTASVVMVRRTLEGVCAENSISEKNLARALERMKSDGLIDDRLFEWAQALRVLGNEGAHYTGDQVDRMDAEDALALAEALLDYMYVLRVRFRQFQTRRDQNASNYHDNDGESSASD
jgi:hypothetical protein